MRLAMFTYGLPVEGQKRGGIERVAHVLAQGLTDRGQEHDRELPAQMLLELGQAAEDVTRFAVIVEMRRQLAGVDVQADRQEYVQDAPPVALG